MSFIDLITGATINRGVDQWRATDGAILIDVRSEEEYGQGGMRTFLWTGYAASPKLLRYCIGLSQPSFSFGLCSL